jgi:ABC-type Fe3+-siderophore transport system permease subunit
MEDKMTAQPQSVKSKAEMVLKTCLAVSMVVGALLVLLAWVGNRDLLTVSSSVLTTVALQWFFYLLVRAKNNSTTIDSDG